MWLQDVTSRLLEMSDRAIALHLTKLDWDILANGFIRSDKEDDASIVSTSINKAEIYEKLFHNSSHRWNHIIERSFTFSHFVVVTILTSSSPEKMLNKWITVANELKTGVGNFFAFCSIMRALLLPQITRIDGRIDWMKLRQKYTRSTLTFETRLRLAFQGLLRGGSSGF